MKKICILIAISLTGFSALAQNQEIQRGNDLYRTGKFDEAGQAYEEALRIDRNNSTAKFNKANSIQRAGRGAEAIREYNDVAFKTPDNELKSKAYYNKGVVLSGEKKLEESIEAYKDALRKNPTDTQARENLQKALLELKKKQPQKKDDQQQKQKQQQKQQQQQQQPKMNQKEAEQRLKLLEQKEKEVQQRFQQQKSQQGGGQQKDW